MSVNQVDRECLSRAATKYSDDVSAEDKKAIRAALEAQVQEFLSSGGKITECKGVGYARAVPSKKV